LEEVAQIIDSITIEQVNQYVAGREFGQFTIVSLGPAPLETGQPPQIEETRVQMAK
jgi:hypothetical protein